MKKICVITGSRSEYGLLKNIIQGIKNSRNLSLQLVVTGSHLSSEFGLTVNQIILDKFKILSKVKIIQKKDNDQSIQRSLSIGVIKFSHLFKKKKPNLILILGDRYEIFAAAISALFLKIPIGHIHGGERSEGAYDEIMRHAITKFSHIHFASTNIYKKRIIQLGENKKNVHLVGSIGVDNIKKLKLYEKKFLEKKYNLKFLKKNLFIIFHPVTLEDNTQIKNFSEILKAISFFPDHGKFFVYPSADLGGRSIIKIIEKYAKKNKNCHVFKSLEQKDYFSFVKYCNIVLGNSSSGIIEVPSLKVGVINVGDRQRGRIKSKAVIDCNCKCQDILKSIKKINKKKYLLRIRNEKNPYYKPNTTKKIIKILEKKKNYKHLIKKVFFDVI